MTQAAKSNYNRKVATQFVNSDNKKRCEIKVFFFSVTFIQALSTLARHQSSRALLMRSLSLGDRLKFDRNLFKSAVLITLTLCMFQFITRIDKAR